MRSIVALVVALVALTVTAAPAAAVVPETEVAGAGKTWLWGTNIQQWGTNCSILGQAKPEPMVSSTALYGGRTGLPAVGEEYWLAVLVSIPGNPCGTGIADVITDLILPPSTTIDGARRIRCFASRRFASDFDEVTDQTFDWGGVAHDYCPDAAGLSKYAGALNFGERLLANGQMFEIFVPVKTSAAIGVDARARWLIDGTGVYSDEQPGTTQVWTTVVGSSLGSTPTIFFTRQSARAYWDKAAPAGTQNRAEFFVSLYTAGKAGNLSWELVNEAGGIEGRSSDAGMNWDGSVATSTLNILQLSPAPDVKGPNGGYVPYYYTKPGARFKLRWKFTTTSPVVTYTKDTDLFRVLPGPDTDGDGVADVEDACPADVGNGTSGCPPVLPVTPSAPTEVVPVQTETKAAIAATLKAPKSVSRKDAATGIPVSFTCDVNAKVRLRLIVDKANQAKLGLTAKAAPLVIASQNATCQQGAKGGKATLKLLAAHTRRIAASRGRAVASLEIVMTASGRTTCTIRQRTTIT